MAQGSWPSASDCSRISSSPSGGPLDRPAPTADRLTGFLDVRRPRRRIPVFFSLFSSMVIPSRQRVGCQPGFPRARRPAAFQGELPGIPEGTPVFAHEPLRVVEASGLRPSLEPRSRLFVVNFQTLIGDQGGAHRAPRPIGRSRIGTPGRPGSVFAGLEGHPRSFLDRRRRPMTQWSMSSAGRSGSSDRPRRRTPRTPRGRGLRGRDLAPLPVPAPSGPVTEDEVVLVDTPRRGRGVRIAIRYGFKTPRGTWASQAGSTAR